MTTLPRGAEPASPSPSRTICSPALVQEISAISSVRAPTSRANRARYGPLVDATRQSQVEEQVTQYFLQSFTFSVIRIDDRERRLVFEKRAIATVAQCPHCRLSPEWLGNFSPLQAIRDSGLWLKQHLVGEPLNPADLEWLDEIIE